MKHSQKNHSFSKLMQRLLLIICAAIFCYSAWQLFQIWKEYQIGDQIYDDLKNQVSADSSRNPNHSPQSGSDADSNNKNSAYYIPEILVDMDSLLSINEDVIGWIQIPDTNIDYPILQGSDNDEYLRRTITGESNKAGCIFADSRCENPFQATTTLLHGHNLLNGKMFSNLMKYEEKSFWEKHPYILIQSKDNPHVMVYEIYSCYRTSSDSTTYTFGLEENSDAYQNYLSNTIQHALYDTQIVLDTSDHILTLSTCTNEEETERFVVQARFMNEQAE